MRIQEATITGWLPPNVANGSVSGAHWSRIRKIHDEGRDNAFWTVKAAQWKRVSGKAHLTITLVFPTARRRDIDNLTARCKGIIDGLVKIGVLADDDSAHLALTVQAEVDAKCICGHARLIHNRYRSGKTRGRCQHKSGCNCWTFKPVRAVKLSLEGEIQEFCAVCGFFPCQCDLSARPVRVGRERAPKTDLQRAQYAEARR